MLAGIIGIHIVSWTLLPLLVHPNAPLDVIEGTVWGREWQLGYAKGPPLFAWILGALDPLEDELRLATIYLVSQLCIALTFYGVWRLGCRVLSQTEALLAVMLMEGVYYFTYPTPELNEIVLQMPSSALLGWIFHRAVTDGRRRDWIIVGILAAIGMWTRYSTAVLLISLTGFLLLSDARRHFRTQGPYIAAATFALLWSPHLLWMMRSGFQSVAYVEHRASLMTAPLDYLFAPLRFALAQIAALFPAVLLTLFWVSRRSARAGRRSGPDRTDRLYIGIVALGPFIVAEMLSLVTGLALRSMWGGPLWCFISLILVAVARPVLNRARLYAFTVAWCIVAALPLVAYAGVHGIGAEVKANEKRSSFPGDALADAITDGWHLATHGKRLQFVVGETWLAGNVAFYSDDRPSTYINADLSVSPWIDPGKLAEAGAVLVWNANREGEAVPARLRKSFPTAVAHDPIILPKQCIFTRKWVRIGWAVVPPASPK